MHQFDEGHKEFKGFSAKYAEDILPILEFMEAERVAAMGQFKGAVSYTHLTLPTIYSV